MIESVLRAPRLTARHPILSTLAVAAELALHGCRIRQARARPGPPSIEIDPPRRGLFGSYARTVPNVAGIPVPTHYATILRGVRVTWTADGDTHFGSRNTREAMRERAR